MHSTTQFTNKNLIVFNYIFPSIDLNFNSAGSQFIKSQPSLKLVNSIKQTASVKKGVTTCRVSKFFNFFFKADAFFYACRMQVNLKEQLHYHIPISLSHEYPISALLRGIKINKLKGHCKLAAEENGGLVHEKCENCDE